MKRKGGLSLEEHQQAGRCLFECRAKLFGLISLLNRYPSSSPAARKFSALLSNLDHLRSILDSYYCAEHRGGREAYYYLTPIEPGPDVCQEPR